MECEQSSSAASNKEPQINSGCINVMFLCDEWKSSKGGLSTFNREFAVNLAKTTSDNIKVYCYVSQSDELSREDARQHGVNLIAARPVPASSDPIDWLKIASPELPNPDTVVGHGRKFGTPAYFIVQTTKCKWVQFVHVFCEDLGKFKATQSAAVDTIEENEKKHKSEIELCKVADVVVAVGSRLQQKYSKCLPQVKVERITPGILQKFSNESTQLVKDKEIKKFNVFMFGRASFEDRTLKGYDIVANAIGSLDKLFELTFVGSSPGEHRKIEQWFLDNTSINRNQITIRSYCSEQEELKMMFHESDVVVVPSRTEGFGMVALEAISAGIPVLVGGESGIAEALHEVEGGKSVIVESDGAEEWAQRIQQLSSQSPEERENNAKLLKDNYSKTHPWSRECEKFKRMIVGLAESLKDLKMRIDVETMKSAEHNTETRTPVSAIESAGSQNGGHQETSAVPVSSGHTQQPSCIAAEDLEARKILTVGEVLRLIATNYLDTTPPRCKDDREDFVKYMEKMKFLVTDVGFGSLLITVRCDALQILERLWEDYSSGHLGDVVQRCFVTEEILTELGLAELKLKSTISKEEYKACKMHFEGDPTQGLKLFVKTVTKKTKITLSAIPDDSVQDVKKKIMDEVGIPGNQQRLSLHGSILEDDHSLGDYNIMKDTVLHLVPLQYGSGMKIHVNMRSGRMITLDVVLEDTIENVKKEILEEEGIPVECQCLFYAAEPEELEDYHTLKEYNIQRGSTLVLTQERLDDMPVFVKMLTGKTIMLNVKPETSIKIVKVAIQRRIGVPPSKQRLDFGVHELKEDCTLREYSIQKESTLYLRVDDQCGSMPIHVLMPSGKMTTLDVLPSGDVKNIKREIYDKDGIPPGLQYLLFDGKELEDGRTLNEFNIQTGSMLHLVLHQSVEKLNSLAGSPRAAKVHIQLRIECQAISRPTPSEMTTQERKLAFQGKTAPPTTSRRTEEASGGFPTAEDVLKLAAFKYLQTTDPSKPQDATSGFAYYLEKIRKVVIVDITQHLDRLWVTVECSSLRILEDLWNDYSSEYLSGLAQNTLVSKDILEELGLTNVKLMTTVSEKEYKDCRVQFLLSLAQFPRRTRIYVKTQTGKTVITLDVELEDTIQNVKTKIADEIGIPVDQQWLTSEDETRECDDDDEVLPEDTLEKVKKEIPAKSRNAVYAGTTGLDAKPETSIKNEEADNQDKEESPPDRQLLILNDEELIDNRTLKYYDIQAGSTLHLFLILRGRIHVKMQTGKMITLEVVPEDTIEKVKEKMVEKGIAVECSHIVYAGKTLEDQRTLGDYNIRRESILHLIPARRDGAMPIRLQTLTGKTITLDVAPQDTVHDVKKEVFLKEGIMVERQSLFYAGEKLNDRKTLKDYNIWRDSVLNLRLKKSPEARLPLLIDCKAISQPVQQERFSQMAATSSAELLTASRKRKAEASWGFTTGQDVVNLAAYKYLQTTDASNGFVYYLEHVRKVVIVDVQPGSLIITVECGSLQILKELWHDYCTGYVSEMAQTFLLTKDILNELGISKVKFSTSIPMEKYKACHEQLQAFDSELQQEYLKLKRLRNEFQNQFRVWVSTRKRIRELLKELEQDLSSQSVQWDEGYPWYHMYSWFSFVVRPAIDEDKNACQGLQRNQNLLESCVADFAAFGRDHIDSVLSSELVEGEFRILLYILRGTHSPGAAANTRVPLPILLDEEVNIHLTRVSTLVEQLWPSTTYQEASAIIRQILDELRYGPNDEEIRIMIMNFIEAKFAEACKS